MASHTPPFRDRLNVTEAKMDLEQQLAYSCWGFRLKTSPLVLPLTRTSLCVRAPVCRVSRCVLLALTLEAGGLRVRERSQMFAIRQPHVSTVIQPHCAAAGKPLPL